MEFVSQLKNGNADTGVPRRHSPRSAGMILSSLTTGVLARATSRQESLLQVDLTPFQEPVPAAMAD